MSLSAALNIGNTALAVAQASIQTTGNNIANADNPNYTRQTAGLASLPSQQYKPGVFIGTGVDLTDITRQIDIALQGRLNASISDDAAASTSQDWLGRIEASFNELNGDGLSTKFSNFFNAWSNLANKPQDQGLRQVVLQNGQSVTDSFQTLQKQLISLQGNVNTQVGSLVKSADALAQQVADLNSQIVASGGNNNALSDQRDAVIQKLAGLVNISTATQADGTVNVSINSEPLVLGTTNRGLISQQTVTAQGTTASVHFRANNGTANVTGGQIGALLDAQSQVSGTVDKLDTIARGLILELNKIHASGQGTEPLSTVTSAYAVSDATAGLNDPQSGLKFNANSGSFVVHVKQNSTGLETSTLVQVDLSGKPTDTSLNDLAGKLNAISGLSVTVAGGKLTINSNSSDTSFSFSQDTSGVLATLGVNNFFTGSNAHDIAVSQVLKYDPAKLAAAKNGDPGDNQTAIAISALQSSGVPSFSGQSLTDTYQSLVNGVATQTSNAKINAEAAGSVKSTLQSQRDALSGVSIDEETVNLLKQQRAFQGAAKFISAIDSMMQTVLQMI